MSMARGEAFVEKLSFSCRLPGAESFHATIKEHNGHLDVFCMCAFEKEVRWRVHFWPKGGLDGHSTFLECGTADEVGEFLLARADKGEEGGVLIEDGEA